MAQEFDVDDLSDVIESLATGDYTVTRFAATTTDGHGRRVAPASSTFEVRGVVYPVIGRSLDRLPEGLRSHETVALVTETELKSLELTSEPDLVTIQGAQYQVAVLERWKPSGNFYRAFCTRVPSS